MKRVCVLGAGSWGSAIAILLANNENDVVLWTRDIKQYEEVKATGENRNYLPGIVLPRHINVTTDILDAIEKSEIIVSAVPSQAFREICKAIKNYIDSNKIVVNLAKGIEKNTCFRLSEVFEQEIPNGKYVMLSGPSHAEEVARELPTTVVVASKNIKNAEIIQDVFMSPVFRVYTNPDVVGVELGGALKNIIAFGAGICDGVGYGDNSKAALMTRGISEISRLGVAMGAEMSTFSGLSGIGDLIVTCTSMHSRNRRAGILIGKGRTIEQSLKEINMVVEGITATQVAYELAKKLNVDLPITNAIYSVIQNGEMPKKVGFELMMRQKKHEMEELIRL